jgi:hypothetical protein
MAKRGAVEFVLVIKYHVKYLSYTDDYIILQGKEDDLHKTVFHLNNIILKSPPHKNIMASKGGYPAHSKINLNNTILEKKEKF